MIEVLSRNYFKTHLKEYLWIIIYNFKDTTDMAPLCHFQNSLELNSSSHLGAKCTTNETIPWDIMNFLFRCSNKLDSYGYGVSYSDRGVCPSVRTSSF